MCLLFQRALALHCDRYVFRRSEQRRVCN
eukprot:COSAG02_NODE_45458_length_357_cov_0.593023_2_plen_28_part_01